MELAVDRFVVRVDQLERVASVSVHEAEAVRRASVGEEEGDLVRRFRSQRDEVPEHVGVFQICLRVSLLSVNEAGKLPNKTQLIISRYSSESVVFSFCGCTSNGSRMKKIGVLFPTRSQLPSSV